jgi:hypothetical protein
VAKFDYNDVVKIKGNTSAERCGEQAWVIAILEDRTRWPLKEFGPGVIYSVEFEDGVAIDIHEDELELCSPRLSDK